MLYLQLYSQKVSGILGEHLGSDGVITLDGRMSIRTALLWASNNIFREEIKGYELRSSPDHRYSTSKAVTPIILIGDL